MTPSRLMHAIFTSARQSYRDIRQRVRAMGRSMRLSAWRQLVKMAAADAPANATLTSFTVARDRASNT